MNKMPKMSERPVIRAEVPEEFFIKLQYLVNHYSFKLEKERSHLP